MPSARETRSGKNGGNRDSIEKFLRKRKAEGSAPNAAPLVNTRKQVRELKLRSLLRLRETDTPSLLETAKAERVINLEEAIGREGEKSKGSLEKQLKEALLDLNDEIKKRPSYKEPIVEINKETPIDVDANEEETEMDIENPSDDEEGEYDPEVRKTKGKATWAEICDSDEEKPNSGSSSDDSMLYEDITGPNSKKGQKSATTQDGEENFDNQKKGCSLTSPSKNDSETENNTNSDEMEVEPEDTSNTKADNKKKDADEANKEAKENHQAPTRKENSVGSPGGGKRY